MCCEWCLHSWLGARTEVIVSKGKSSGQARESVCPLMDWKGRSSNENNTSMVKVRRAQDTICETLTARSRDVNCRHHRHMIHPVSWSGHIPSASPAAQIHPFCDQVNQPPISHSLGLSYPQIKTKGPRQYTSKQPVQLTEKVSIISSSTL